MTKKRAASVEAIKEEIALVEVMKGEAASVEAMKEGRSVSTGRATATSIPPYLQM